MYPWKETAVLVKDDGTGKQRELLLEGNLDTVTASLAKIVLAEITRLSISLPDRRVAPFGFEHGEFADLIAAHKALSRNLGMGAERSRGN